MAYLGNDYATALSEKRILYVPSCVIVEMLAKLHEQMSAVNIAGSLHNVTPDLLILLRRMQRNVHVTAEAYDQGRIRYFIGDWNDDKRRARRLFFNIMSRLGYISELLEKVERSMLFAAIEGVTAEWAALDRLMDAKADERKCHAGGICNARCHCGDASWRQAMAESIAGHQDTPGDAPADSLFLVCYNKAKWQLLAAVKDVMRYNGVSERLTSDRVLSVSKETAPLVCQKCTEPCSASALRESRTTRRQPSARTHFRRYVIPSGFADLAAGT